MTSPRVVRFATDYLCPIDPSDGRDVTAELNTWINTVPDGSTARLAPVTYRTDGVFQIFNRNRMLIDGGGAILERQTPTPAGLPDHNRHIYIDGCTDLTLTNLKVQGLNTVSDIDPASGRGQLTFEPLLFGSMWTTEGFGECGVMVRGSQRITVREVEVDGTWGDGMSVGHDNAPSSTRIELRNIVIDRNGRQGLSIVSADHVLLDNVQIMHSHTVGIDSEPNGANSSAQNVEIRNCYVNSYGVAIAITGSELTPIRNDHFYFHDNTIAGTLQSWPWFHGGAHHNATRIDWRIEDNTVLWACQGMRIWGVTDGVIKGNTFPVALAGGGAGVPTYPGIVLANIGGTITIQGNTAVDAISVYTNDGTGTGVVQACGNRIVADAPFDQPTPCATGIARVGTTTTSSSNGTVTDTITATLPTGRQTGDLILVAAGNAADVTPTWSAASYTGWTIAEDILETGTITRILYRFADGTSADNPPAMTASVSAQMGAQCAVYRGVNTSTPFIAEGGQPRVTTAGTAQSAPALTNTNPNAWGVLAGAATRVVTPLTWTVGAGLVELQDDDTGSAALTNYSMLWADSDGPVPTGSVTYTATTSGSTARASMWAALLNPAS